MIHEIRCMMERVPCLRGAVSRIQQTEIMRKRHDYLEKKRADERWYVVAGKQMKKFADYYDAHEQDFRELEAMLEDEFSRRTLRTVVRFYKEVAGGRKITRSYCKRAIGKVVVQPQYFQKDILKPIEGEVFVDGGAYVGDTIRDLIQFGGGHYWKKVYAWEPDAENRRALAEQYGDCADIEIVPRGLWSEEAELRFRMGGSPGSRISDEGTQTVQVDTIDRVCGGDRVTFIKMDIEGSEQEALRGAETVIRRDKPRLSICLYHKPEDYVAIPRLVREMVPEYKLYIRQHNMPWGDTVLYAIPPGGGAEPHGKARRK